MFFLTNVHKTRRHCHSWPAGQYVSGFAITLDNHCSIDACLDFFPLRTLCLVARICSATNCRMQVCFESTCPRDLPSHHARFKPDCAATETSCALGVFKLEPNHIDADQTAQMRSLVSVFVVCIQHTYSWTYAIVALVFP